MTMTFLATVHGSSLFATVPGGAIKCTSRINCPLQSRCSLRVPWRPEVDDACATLLSLFR